jgi:hypothetical protein
MTCDFLLVPVSLSRSADWIVFDQVSLRVVLRVSMN